MRNISKTKKIILGIMAVLIFILILALDNRLELRRYTIETEKIEGDVKVLLLTDLHSCSYGENQMDLISAIHKEKPDVILLGGDIYDDEMPNENTTLVLEAIADKYPCYYVTGNHEYWTNDIEPILDLFRGFGITILEGTYDTIEIRGQEINICGVSDSDNIYYTYSNYSIYRQLDDLANVHENGNYTILLAHRPEQIERYRQYNFDLVLSGHAHGGQWRLPGVINGLYAPNQGLFPKYAGGQYDFEELTFIVSRGLAKESTRVPRLFNPPELIVIELK